MATWDNDFVLIQDFIKGLKEILTPICAEVSESQGKKAKLEVKNNSIYIDLKDGFFKPKEKLLETNLECLMTNSNEYELKVRFTIDETKIHDDHFFENFLKDVKAKIIPWMNDFLKDKGAYRCELFFYDSDNSEVREAFNIN